MSEEARAKLLAGIIKSRLAMIRKDAGYRSDAGRNVYHGPVKLSLPDNERDASAVVFTMDDEAATDGSESRKVRRTVKVTGIIAAPVNCPRGEALEDIRLDILRALGCRGSCVAILAPAKRGSPTEGSLTYQSAQLVPRVDGQNFEGLEMSFQLDFTEEDEEEP